MNDPSISQRRKTSEQVAAIEAVQCAVETAATQVVSYLVSSDAPCSEEAHKIIDQVLENFGCESPEGHIVAGGIQSAAPHAEGRGYLERGEPIVIDIYPRSKTTGYFADMTRTVCLGQPTARLQEMYEAVLNAQELAISLVKPGTACQDIQEEVEKFFAKAGFMTSGKGDEKEGFAYAEGFVHGVGHGVGLDIHEAPKVKRSTDILAEGDVITIEPGLYYKAVGGVRIEDMLLVIPGGYRNLTKFSKALVI